MKIPQRGVQRISQPKGYVLEVLRSHPDAEAEGQGIFQEEVARPSWLHSRGIGELDHTCSEMLKLPQREGLVELI